MSTLFLAIGCHNHTCIANKGQMKKFPTYSLKKMPQDCTFLRRCVGRIFQEFMLHFYSLCQLLFNINIDRNMSYHDTKYLTQYMNCKEENQLTQKRFPTILFSKRGKQLVKKTVCQYILRDVRAIHAFS